jgi:hypothetical protein
MTTAILPHPDRPAALPSPVTSTVGAALTLWLGLVFTLGAAGALAPAPGQPPLPIFAGFAVPLLGYAIAYRASASFRAFVLGLGPVLTTSIQAWRFGGLAFIALFTYDVLPGAFAWPAGLGDIAIGATAPAFALAIARAPRVAASRGFVLWNLLGILDLVVAVGSGTLIAWFGLGADPASMSAMPRLPLVLIPAFLVPIFVMLHITALVQAKHLASSIDR